MPLSKSDYLTSQGIAFSIKPLRPLLVNGWLNEPRDDLFLISLHLKKNTSQRLFCLARIPKSPQKILVCFHGLIETIHPHFYDVDGDALDDYVVLFPQDPYHTCWLGGHHGPASWSYPLLIYSLVHHLSSHFDLQKTIFMGTSMGGFGALMHSFFVSADEVYLCSPITNLDPSLEFNASGSVRSSILSTGIDDFTEASKHLPFLNATVALDSFGHNCLIANRKLTIGKPSYCHLLNCRYESKSDRRGIGIEDFCLPLLSGLARNGVNFFVNFLPIAGHDALIYPRDVIRYSDQQNINKILSSAAPVRYSRRDLVEENLFTNLFRLNL